MKRNQTIGETACTNGQQPRFRGNHVFPAYTVRVTSAALKGSANIKAVSQPGNNEGMNGWYDPDHEGLNQWWYDAEEDREV